ncbi:MAG: thioredoxin family protein [Bacteroidota bacterium]
MRHFINFLLLLALAINANAQGNAIDFETGSWTTILAKAKTENKLIFIDAYTSWCAPCKKMAKEVFPQTEVADFYNRMFVNVKMDMENGEGVNLARTYNVNVYPTLLFINGEGNLVHRSAGYHNVEQFLALGTEALDPSMQIGVLKDRFEKGERDPDFLKTYTMAAFQSHDGSHVPVAEAYLATQEDWSTEENRKFLFNFIGSTNTKMFDYLVDHQDAFSEMYGQRAVSSKIQELIYGAIQDSAGESSLEQIDRLFARAYPEKAAELSSRFRMSFYRQAGDRENYALAAITHFKQYPSNDHEELNETAWTFFRITKDKKQLKQAVKWAKKSIKLDNNYYNNDTLASLYYALGKKRKAKKSAQKAIALAKASQIDYAPTEETLNKLENMGKKKKK